MIRSSILAAAALAGAAALLLPFARGAAAPAQEPGSGHETGHEEDSPLVQAMERVDKGMKALRRSVADPAKAEANAELARGMKEAALTALPLCPEPFTPLEGVARVAWRIDFERRILAVADTLLQLELAFVESRLEDAKKLHEGLAKLKKDGHDLYVPPEEE